MNCFGQVQYGWYEDGSGLYYLSSTGAMVKNRWLNYEGSKYYLTYDGTAATGKQMIDGDEYYFRTTGELVIEETVDGITTDENGMIVSE